MIPSTATLPLSLIVSPILQPLTTMQVIGKIASASLYLCDVVTPFLNRNGAASGCLLLSRRERERGVTGVYPMLTPQTGV